ncbi:MAG TPA: SDR family oxidoreductase [Candidatus Thermoplasmatota archaeon]|nr:SDR family oxidoreductase [Candidatus Thermoplasmatota archaeon]
MDLGLKGKRAIVMGGSEGLGKASAVALARDGASVVICARREEPLRATVAELQKLTPGKVKGVRADVASASDLACLFEEAVAEMGGLDILVTNSGGPPPGFFMDFDDRAWQDAFNLVVMSNVRAIRLAIPHLERAGGGSIVNIVSTSVKQPIQNLVLSNSLRMAVVGLAKTLAQQYAPKGIRVNNVLPGSMATARIHKLTENRAAQRGIPFEQAWKEREKEVPMGRIGDPMDLGNAVAFLASPAAGYVTGATLQVDGGVVQYVM